MRKVFLVAEIDATGKAIDISVGIETVSGSVEHLERKLRYRSPKSAQDAIDQLDGIIEMMVIGKRREQFLQ